MEHHGCGPRGRGSRTTGNNWSRGYKTYRHGKVAGFVAALERLAVREISDRFLSQDERIEIADLRGCRAEHAADRRPAGTGAVDDLPGAAPQRGQQRAVPVRSRPSGATVRRARLRQRRIETSLSSGRWPGSCWPSVEPAADQPPLAPAVS